MMATSTGKGSSSPFDSNAAAYDAWFDGEGKAIFAVELEALRRVSSGLPRPWLEVGVGSGRFAQALGIEAGIDPSRKLLKMARERGIIAFRAQAEEYSLPTASAPFS